MEKYNKPEIEFHKFHTTAIMGVSGDIPQDEDETIIIKPASDL